MSATLKLNHLGTVSGWSAEHCGVTCQCKDSGVGNRGIILINGKRCLCALRTPNLKVSLDELVEPRSPRIELEEGPAGEVGHEDGVGGEVDQGGPVSCAVPEDPCRSQSTEFSRPHLTKMAGSSPDFQSMKIDFPWKTLSTSATVGE